MNNRELVDRYLNQDPEAVRELDRWIHAAAYPYRPRLAWVWEDVLQDLRLEIYQLFRRDAFQGKSSLKSYIWSVVNHSCIDHLRKTAKNRLTGLCNLEKEAPVVTDPTREIRETDLARSLLRILNQAPEQCRQLWDLILAGQNLKQMSEQLKITEGTLRVRVHRCRKKAVSLREKLAKQ